MKKIIITLALIFALAPIAHAENVSVFDGGSDNVKVIMTTSDEGITRSYISNRVSDTTWIVTGDDGSATIVNDFSGGNDRDSE